MKKTRAELEDEHGTLRLALRSLVELKHYKDEFGKTSFYESQREHIWSLAERTLEATTQ